MRVSCYSYTQKKLDIKSFLESKTPYTPGSYASLLVPPVTSPSRPQTSHRSPDLKAAVSTLFPRTPNNTRARLRFSSMPGDPVGRFGFRWVSEGHGAGRVNHRENHEVCCATNVHEAFPWKSLDECGRWKTVLLRLKDPSR